MPKKLREHDNQNVYRFEIINQATKQYIETLDRDEAVAKYGDCEVWSSYTSGHVYGKGHVVDIWVWRKEV